MYLNPEHVKSKEAVAFEYAHLIQHEVQNECEVLPGDVNTLYLPDEKNGADDIVFSNTDTVRMTEEGGGYGAMNL